MLIIYSNTIFTVGAISAIITSFTIITEMAINTFFAVSAFKIMPTTLQVYRQNTIHT